MKHLNLKYCKLIVLSLTVFAVINISEAQDTNYCGTPRILRQFHLNGTIEPVPTLSGPTESIGTPHFLILYTQSGSDATTRPWVDSVAVYAETCWVRSERLGWAMPPPSYDGTSKYYIYIVGIGDTGNTSMSRQYNDSLLNYSDAWASIIRIKSSFMLETNAKTFARLRAVVAHEFSHACQFRYAATDEETSIYENTSVYMERVIFHDVNDINTLSYRLLVEGNPLNNPQSSVVTFHPDGFMYAGGLWPTFLSEFYRDDDSLIVRRAWEFMGENMGENTLSAIDDALTGYTIFSDLQHALKYYAVWRYFTGDRSDNYHFTYAKDYPTSFVLQEVSSYPAAGNPTTRISAKGGTSFIKFTNIRPRLTITFAGQNTVQWAAFAIGYGNNREPVLYEFNLDRLGQNGLLSITVAGFDSLVLIPVVVSWEGALSPLGYSYSYQAATSPATDLYFTNKVGTEDAGGRLLRAELDTVVSGNYILLVYGTDDSVRTLNERLFISDSTIKHHDWNNIQSENKLKHKFVVRDNQDANFQGIKSVTIRNELIGAPSLSGGTLKFRDPWYLHSNGTQPDSFFTYNLSAGPFQPSGAYNQTTGGVFLNQDPALNMPCYYVRVESTQTIGGYTAKFVGWDTSGAYLVSMGGNTPGYNEKAVIFRSANAVVKALYNVVITANTLVDWNMASTPVIVADNRKSIIWPTATSVAFAYEGSYVPKDTILKGKGIGLSFQVNNLSVTLVHF